MLGSRSASLKKDARDVKNAIASMSALQKVCWLLLLIPLFPLLVLVLVLTLLFLLLFPPLLLHIYLQTYWRLQNRQAQHQQYQIQAIYYYHPQLTILQPPSKHLMHRDQAPQELLSNHSSSRFQILAIRKPNLHLFLTLPESKSLQSLPQPLHSQP